MVLEPGWYWFASNNDNAVAIFASVANTSGLHGATFGCDTTSNTITVNGLSKSQTFGTWPTLTGNMTTDNISYSNSNSLPVVMFSI